MLVVQAKYIGSSRAQFVQCASNCAAGAAQEACRDQGLGLTRVQDHNYSQRGCRLR